MQELSLFDFETEAHALDNLSADFGMFGGSNFAGNAGVADAGFGANNPFNSVGLSNDLFSGMFDTTPDLPRVILAPPVMKEPAKPETVMPKPAVPAPAMPESKVPREPKKFVT